MNARYLGLAAVLAALCLTACTPVSSSSGVSSSSIAASSAASQSSSQPESQTESQPASSSSSPEVSAAPSQQAKRMTSRTQTDPQGSVLQTSQFEYDAKGRLVRSEETTFGPDSSRVVEQQWSADDILTQQTITFSSRNSDTAVQQIHMDDHGNPIEEISTSNGEVIRTVTYAYTYDSQGRVTRMDTTENDTLTSTTTYTYSQDSSFTLPVEELVRDAQGNLTQQCVRKPGVPEPELYLETITRADTSGTKIRHLRIVDQQPVFEKDTTIARGAIILSYAYDDYGHLTQLSGKRAGSAVQEEHQYQLDDQGNVLRCTNLNQGSVVSIEEYVYELLPIG